MAFYSDRYLSECNDQLNVQRGIAFELKHAVERKRNMNGFSWEQTVDKLVLASMRVEALIRHIADCKEANRARIEQERKEADSA